jgi:hypothetical protein
MKKVIKPFFLPFISFISVFILIGCSTVSVDSLPSELKKPNLGSKISLDEFKDITSDFTNLATGTGFEKTLQFVTTLKVEKYKSEEKEGLFLNSSYKLSTKTLNKFDYIFPKSYDFSDTNSTARNTVTYFYNYSKTKKTAKYEIEGSKELDDFTVATTIHGIVKDELGYIEYSSYNGTKSYFVSNQPGGVFNSEDIIYANTYKSINNSMNSDDSYNYGFDEILFAKYYKTKNTVSIVYSETYLDEKTSYEKYIYSFNLEGLLVYLSKEIYLITPEVTGSISEKILEVQKNTYRKNIKTSDFGYSKSEK